MRCANCGLSLQEGDARCPRCGGLVTRAPFPPPPPDEPETPPYGLARTPPAPARRGGLGIPVLVVGLVLLMAVVATGITLVVKQHAAAAAPPSEPTPAGISSVVAQPSAPALPPVSAAPSSSEPEQPPSNAAAKADLDNEVDQDRESAEALVGNWVPQLSSKRPGLVADGITYDYQHIWANFQRLKSQYPTALLLWSGDYVSFKSPNFYVTVVAQPSADGPSANEWCDNAELAPDDCYAKFLSHEGGPSGTTLLRH